jgi:polyvinyl alcohol dehydrogenase (cytochrome)
MKKLNLMVLLAALGLAGCEQPADPAQQVHAGQAVYEENCASCHAERMARTPHAALLRQMTADNIYRALTEGMMQEQSSHLSTKDKEAVSEYLSGMKIGETTEGAGIPQCKETFFSSARKPVSKDWGINAERTRYQDGPLNGFPDDKLETLEIDWVIALPNTIQMRSQPAFAGGFMYMGSQNGTVYALDHRTGCQHWTFQATAEVRTSFAITTWPLGELDKEPVLIFGDHVGYVYGLDARSGELIWKVRPHDHPHAKVTGSPRIMEDKVIVPFASHEDQSAANPDYPCCTFRGALAALDTKTGETVWMSYTIPEESTLQGHSSVGTEQYGPAGATIWNTPSMDFKRRQIYVGTSNNYANPDSGTSDSVLAFDMDTGALNWVYRGTVNDRWNVACMAGIRGPNCPEPEGPDFDMGAGTMLVTDKNGKDIVIAGQKSSDAHGIDPDTGEGIWRHTLGRGGIQGGIHFGMAAHDGVAYIPVSDMIYDGDAATYEREPRPGLFALDAASGQEIWAWEPTEDTCMGREGCDPGIAAPPTVIGDYVMTNGLDGWVRIHRRQDGVVVWSLDTTQPMEGINGVVGQGGSMNGAGPIATVNRVYIMSGYAFAGHMPGNLLISLIRSDHKDD